MKHIAITLLMALGIASAAAQSAADTAAVAPHEVASTDTTSAEEGGIDMIGVISHHISDSHWWNVHSYKNSEGEIVSINIPLPVMAYYDGDFLFCMASAFDNGGTVEKNGVVYEMHHDKLHVRGSEEKPFDFSITRNVASMLMSVVIILLIFVGSARGYKKSLVPHGGQTLVEMVVLFVKEIADDQIGKEKAPKYTNFLLTLFFFIWFNNFIGLIPFFPGGTNLSGNISFTAILAVFTFIVTNVNGTKGYWKHNFTVPGVPLILKPILVPIEIVTMFTRPFTLMIRLFANITCGHIIIISLVSLIFVMQSYGIASIAIPLTMFSYVLELIFGVLQAYIFTLLSALYIGLAVNQEDHHE